MFSIKQVVWKRVAWGWRGGGRLELIKSCLELETLIIQRQKVNNYIILDAIKGIECIDKNIV